MSTAGIDVHIFARDILKFVLHNFSQAFRRVEKQSLLKKCKKSKTVKAGSSRWEQKANDAHDNEWHYTKNRGYQTESQLCVQYWQAN